jgi:sugar lactone lactonase YvrE
MISSPRHSIASFLLALAAFIFTAPVGAFNSASWTPERAPAWRGVLERNKKLSSCQLIGKRVLRGPEDLAVDPEGRIYCGSAKSGKIYRVVATANGAEQIEVFADTGGHNLGLKLASNGYLYACNVPKGLLMISPKGEVSVLTEKADDGSPLTFADDLDIDSAGKIYFSNASSKYNGLNGARTLRFDLLEGNPYGGLYVYDPSDKSTKLLVGGLYFANGVALSKNADYVLVNETCHYQTTRYWLKGPKAGTHDLFASNLPGLPDGITTDSSGDFWISLPCYRRPHLDFLQHNPKIKNILSHTPECLWGRTPHYGFVIRMNEAAEILESLQDPHGKIWCVTNVVPWHDYLFLGTLEGHAIARYKRPM